MYCAETRAGRPRRPFWQPAHHTMPSAARSAVRNATNLLTATPLEAAIIIACALTDPGDLLHLAVAVPRRFATKCIAAPASSHRTTASGGTAAAAATAGAPDL
eukprot:COSAG06_NODE_36562_length_445_cov_1.367052_1_plen_102_part_10